MILSDNDIHQAIVSGEIKITGWDGELYVGPSSLDLHLDNRAMVLDRPANLGYIYLDRRLDVETSFTDDSGWDNFTLFPGEFYIMSTVEHITLPKNIAGFLQGRSSIARLGIDIHAAGFFDPGFSGNATLEVMNLTNVPIVVPKHTRICQMVFMHCNEATVGYADKADQKYQGQLGPTLSKISNDFRPNGN